MKHAKAIAIDPNTLFTMVFPFRGICAEYTPGLSAAIHKYGDVLLLASVGRLPLLARRGGCAIKKKLRSNLSGADGVVVQSQRINFQLHRRSSISGIDRNFSEGRRNWR